MQAKRVALVTGGNRGLGFETCRGLAQLGYQVILTSRDKQQGLEKASQLKQEGLDVEFLPLDMADAESIRILHQQIEEKWGRLDVLINNAGILIDKEAAERKGLLPEKESFEIHRQKLEQTLQTNLIGPYELCDRLAPLMYKHHYGRIVNISSGLGQISNMEDGYESYRLSKLALNGVTRIFAARYKGSNILINSVCPGWVRTDMGGASAKRSIDEGIRGIIWAATLPDNSVTGGFFRDGEAIDW